MIRVVMIVRSTLFTVKGGDTVQVTQTANNLRKQEVLVDIKLSNEKINYNNYDLLHFFNIMRPADILSHINATQKPFVVSTIFVDYSLFDKHYRRGFSGFLFRFLKGDHIEYIKTIARWLKGNDKTISATYILNRQRRSIIKILQESEMLLPNSESEYQRLAAIYPFQTKYTVVPNAVNPYLFRYNERAEKDLSLVLCVARIEGIKNQLNLIRAVNNTKYQLLIIGSPAPNQMAYYHACRKEAASNITFIAHLPQEELIQYYQKAKVHVLPSYFETTGLSSLEAAAMGCNIVITDKGDTRYYFADDAVYCEPHSPESIYDAIEQAAHLPINITLQSKIITSFTWQQATSKTLDAYRCIKSKWG